ncbi:MAG: peptide chain release factor 2 [Planctomycetota bacterium]
MEYEFTQTLQKLRAGLRKLQDSLDFPAKQKLVEELEAKMSEPGFWDDQDAAQDVIRRLKATGRVVEDFEKIDRELSDIADLAEMVEGDEEQERQLEAELEAAQVRYEALELQTLFDGPHDLQPAIVMIQAGTGGTDASDFAGMLMRMYQRWGEHHDMKVEINDIERNDEAGINRCELRFVGDYAYGKLRCEIGVHRLVRISPFNSAGKRQTSFVAVDVLPELADDSEIEVLDKDLRIDTYRAGGKGGQHVNTTDSAVRITHIPTGVVVSCQNERSQHKNKAAAMKVLKMRLVRQKEMEREKELAKLYGEKGEIGFGSQIRSYTLQPYTLVKDHRTTPAIEDGNVQGVLDGNIDKFIEGYLRWKLMGVKK